MTHRRFRMLIVATLLSVVGVSFSSLLVPHSLAGTMDDVCAKLRQQYGTNATIFQKANFRVKETYGESCPLLPGVQTGVPYTTSSASSSSYASGVKCDASAWQCYGLPCIRGMQRVKCTLLNTKCFNPALAKPAETRKCTTEDTSFAIMRPTPVASSSSAQGPKTDHQLYCEQLRQNLEKQLDLQRGGLVVPLRTSLMLKQLQHQGCSGS